MFNISKLFSDNANELIDIDIKCFDNPWDTDYWAEITKHPNYALYVVKYRGTPTGFAVVHFEEDTAALLKICVKKERRRQRASWMLLYEVFNCVRAKQFNEVHIVVPESLVYPGPDSISKYLIHVGFQPTKPFLRNHFHSCGESEAGVKFVAPASTVIPMH